MFNIEFNYQKNKITGSFLSGLFRAVIPIVKKGGTALGQELLRTGVGLAGDVWKTGDLKEAQKTRGKEFISNISNRVSEHMFGKGYIHNLGMNSQQLSSSVGTRKTGKVTKRKTTTKRKPTKKKKKPAAKKKKKAPAKKGKTKRNKQDIQDIFA